MRITIPLAATACLLAFLTPSTVQNPRAMADSDAYALNGTYSVVSNGEFAQMNDRYQDEPTVKSTWTINTTCSAPGACAGKVTSSLGWTEDIYIANGASWYVRHAVPDWIPCPDGTTAPGLQVYRFYRANDVGYASDDSEVLVGDDRTTGESGNCGRNTSLVLQLPVKITKIV